VLSLPARPIPLCWTEKQLARTKIALLAGDRTARAALNNLLAQANAA